MFLEEQTQHDDISMDIDGVKTKNKRVNFDDKGVVEYWVKQNILGLILKFVRYRTTTTIKHENLINDTDNQLDKLSNAIDVDFDREWQNCAWLDGTVV